MSFRANRLHHSPPHEDGYVLPSVILVLTVGAMVAIALLGYAAALLKAGGDDADSVLHLYAADAGITTMKRRLEQGTAIPPTPFTFGGVKVEVGVTPIRAPRAPLPTLTPQPVASGLPDLSDEYSVIIESVPRGSVLDVRWRYVLLPTASPEPSSDPAPASDPQLTGDHSPTPTPTPTGSPQPTSTPIPTSTPTPVPPSIEVYVSPRSVAEGTPTPTPIVTSAPCHPDGQRNCVEIVEQPLDLLEREEDIEVVFDPGEDMVSAPWFAPTCPAAQNRPYFCLTAAPMDYVVESTTGSATVTAYIRQFPGWRPDDSSDDGVTYKRYDVVKILSWKPHPPSSDEPPDAPNE